MSDTNGTSTPKIGRPPIPYDDSIAEHICEQIAQGRSLTKIVKDDDEVPVSLRTINKWLVEIDSFAQAYAQARERQADYFADELLSVCAKAYGSDSMAHVQAARLEVDTLKWIASKLKPRVYSDKIQAELSGPNGGPIPIVASVSAPRKLSPDEWLELYSPTQAIEESEPLTIDYKEEKDD